MTAGDDGRGDGHDGWTYLPPHPGPARSVPGEPGPADDRPSVPGRPGRPTAVPSGSTDDTVTLPRIPSTDPTRPVADPVPDGRGAGDPQPTGTVPRPPTWPPPAAPNGDDPTVDAPTAALPLYPGTPGSYGQPVEPYGQPVEPYAHREAYGWPGDQPTDPYGYPAYPDPAYGYPVEHGQLSPPWWGRGHAGERPDRPVEGYQSAAAGHPAPATDWQPPVHDPPAPWAAGPFPGHPAGGRYAPAAPPQPVGAPSADSAVRRHGPRQGRSEQPADGGERPERRGMPLWQELPLLLVIALCLAILVRTFLLQAFFIPSGSMEDTLVAGDRVLVNKLVYHFREPVRGEVVVFEGTDAWAPIPVDGDEPGRLERIGRALGDLVGISRPGARDYIKRVIGLPGDRVACCDQGRVTVNGQPLEEDYISEDSQLVENPVGGHDCRRRQFDEVVVRPGYMFVMGDHRSVSQDSRCQGQVPIDNIIGRAFVVVWPTDRWAVLSQPDTSAGDASALSESTGRGRATGAAGPVTGAGLGFLGPILLPIGTAFQVKLARSRLIGRRAGRRLAA